MAQIDEVISPQEQKRWLSDANYQTEWSNASNPPENRHMVQDKIKLYHKFMDNESHLPIIEFLQHYIPKCLPYFRTTEQNFWALSIATTYGPIFAVNGIQTLVDVFVNNGKLVLRWYLFEENLHNAFGENTERLKDEYPLASYEESGLVAAGPNQIQLFTWIEDAVRLCHDEAFLKEVRAFTLRVLRKGGRRPGQFSYHSFLLIDEVVTRLKNIETNPVQVDIPASLEIKTTVTGFEGREVLRKIMVRERDPLLISKAKEAFKQKHNRLFCEICEFDFFTLYGELAEACIEVHHLNPIGERLPTGEATSINDLLLVCANCHTVIHHQKPILTVEALRQIVNQNRRES